jgi:hypothetical protein
VSPVKYALGFYIPEDGILHSPRSRFSVVFLGPRANAEVVPKFHVALYASHAALPMVISKFSSNAAR